MSASQSQSHSKQTQHEAFEIETSRRAQPAGFPSSPLPLSLPLPLLASSPTALSASSSSRPRVFIPELSYLPLITVTVCVQTSAHNQSNKKNEEQQQQQQKWGAAAPVDSIDPDGLSFVERGALPPAYLTRKRTEVPLRSPRLFQLPPLECKPC